MLPIALGLATSVAMDRGWDVSRAVSAGRGTAHASWDPVAPTRSGKWWDYLAGSVAEVAATGAAVAAVDVAVVSDLPTGAGLSSSAAIEVATAAAALRLAGSDVDAREVALAAHRAETGFVGVPCGIMDQFASALARAGHALHLDCQRTTTEHVPFTGAVLVFDTATPRGLRRSAYAERRDECLRALAAVQREAPGTLTLADATLAQVEGADMDDTARRRARHVVTEVARVRAAVARLKESGELSGELLLASHASLRDDYACSTPELDWFVETAMTHGGVTGARLTGAGWGGCAIATGDEDALRALAHLARHWFAARFGRNARAFVTRAHAGVRLWDPQELLAD